MLILKILILVLAGGAALFDLRTRKVPNLYLLAFAGAGLVLKGMLFGPSGLLDVLGAVLLVLLLIGWLFLFRMLGAGDIKLFAVCGIYTGAKSVLYLLLFSFLFAGVFAFAKMVGGGNVKDRFRAFSRYVADTLTQGFANRRSYLADQEEGHKVCMAVFIFIGALLWAGGVY